TASQLNELSRCASDARRLLNARDTPDRNTRVLASATRVLAEAGGPAAEQSAPPDTAIQDRDEFLWNLTLAVTALRAEGRELFGIDEAVAALQLLSSTLLDAPAMIPARIKRLRELQASAPASIRTRRNGPYILTNAGSVTDWLGQELTVPPTVALCR